MVILCYLTAPYVGLGAGKWVAGGVVQEKTHFKESLWQVGEMRGMGLE